MDLRGFICVFSIILLVGCQSSSIDNSTGNKTIQLKSTAFKDGDKIPERYTCDGQDLSLPLTVNSIPDQARSLAVTIEDPDAPGGVFDHWLIWNVDSTTTTLPEDIPPQGKIERPIHAVQGKNSFGVIGYRGPCPPKGQNHQYQLTVYALDRKLDVKAGARKPTLKETMEGHVLASDELVGTYGR